MSGAEPAAPMNVLLLCDYDPFQAQMVQDHIHALTRLSAHRVSTLSFAGDLPSGLDLDRFDALIVHYSVFIYSDRYLSPAARARIAAFAGVKAVFLHDEYKHVDLTTERLRELGATILFTCMPPAAIPRVYPESRLPGVVKINVLTGYVPDHVAAHVAPTPPSRRPIDIGYRGRRYPFWHGALGREREIIAARVAADAARAGLRTDISILEKDRLYGARWLAFLGRCKATLGTESGASVIDFTGRIAAAVEDYVATHPAATYEEARERFFADVEEQIPMRQISPRMFEAIACRSVLILYEGEYSGILEPERHYFPLRRDHANFAGVVRLMRDDRALDAMAERAYADVIAGGRWSDRSLARLVDAALSAAAGAARRKPPCPPEEFARAFGRYDALLNRRNIRRQAFGLAYRAYGAATRMLPPPVEARLRSAIKAALSRPRRSSGRPPGKSV